MTSGSNNDDDFTNRRRQFIMQRVLQAGRVHKIDIEFYLSREVNDASIAKDAEYFQHEGIPITKVGSDFVSSQYILYEKREKEDTESKRAIGAFTAALLCATPVDDSNDIQFRDLHESLGYASQLAKSYGKNQQTRLVESIKEAIETFKKRSEIQPILKDILETLENRHGTSSHAPAHASPSDLVQRVHDLHSKGSRLIALDAGTTCHAIANALKNHPNSKRVHLRVLTNSPRLERVLESPDSAVEVVSLGGALRKLTLARAGTLADMCLEAWSSIRLDVTIVGTTGFHYDRQNHPRAFACDSEAEARIKSKFLEMSGLRCVSFSSSKCQGTFSSAIAFADVSSRHVDMILTDDGAQRLRGLVHRSRDSCPEGKTGGSQEGRSRWSCQAK